MLYPDEGTHPFGVWIYNDDAEAVTGFGHYGGMRRLKSPSQPDKTGILADVEAGRSRTATTASISDEGELIPAYGEFGPEFSVSTNFAVERRSTAVPNLGSLPGKL